MTALFAALTIFAASSLHEAFVALGKAFQQQHPGAEVEFNFAGSQELRVQLENGARADVFASADARHMEALQQQGLVSEPKVFARNELVLITPAANPARIHALADLPKARRIVLGAAAVPVGGYSEQLLGAQGEAFRAAVLARVVSRELNVRQVLAKVALGEADAGIVYRTDAATAKDRVQSVELPGAPVAEYPIAALGASPLGREFVELVLSQRGRDILRHYGFR